MTESFEIRIPRWLVFVVAAVLLVGAGVGAGLVAGGGSDDRAVDTRATRGSTTSSTAASTSTTSTTAAPAADAGGGDNAGNAGGGNAGNGGNAGGGNAGNDGGGAVAPPPPAATADVSSSKTCPQQTISWNGSGGTNGYTLQVYNAVPGGAMLFNGAVDPAGSKSFPCAGNLGGIQIPTVGLVRFNVNTATGTVSDTA